MKFAYNFNSICMSFKWGHIYKSTVLIRIQQSSILKRCAPAPACCRFVPIEAIVKKKTKKKCSAFFCWRAFVFPKKFSLKTGMWETHPAVCAAEGICFTPSPRLVLVPPTELSRRISSKHYQEKCIVFFGQWPNAWSSSHAWSTLSPRCPLERTPACGNSKHACAAFLLDGGANELFSGCWTSPLFCSSRTDSRSAGADATALIKTTRKGMEKKKNLNALLQ